MSKSIERRVKVMKEAERKARIKETIKNSSLGYSADEDAERNATALLKELKPLQELELEKVGRILAIVYSKAIKRDKFSLVSMEEDLFITKLAQAICQRFGTERKPDYEEVINVPPEGITVDVFAKKNFRGKTILSKIWIIEEGKGNEIARL